MNWIITPEWSLFTISIYCLVLVSAISSAFLERKGLMSIRYSKFRSDKGISSRVGMFIIYFIPFLVHLPALSLFEKSSDSNYFNGISLVQWLFAYAILIHFFKRCAEVLLVHKYSGPIEISTVIQITMGYTALSIYAAYLVPDSIQSIDGLTYLGLLFFIVGQFGNFYHHKLLADLRESEAAYFIPKGAFFNYVSCPHYFFEVIAWLGIALISRHIDMFILTIIMASYLSGRSAKVTEWYREKFADYPQSRKHIFPFVF